MGARFLADVEIVEWGGGIGAAYAGKLLADLGARVRKIVPPAGDPVRLLGPFPPGRAAPETAGLDAYLNGVKQAEILDVDSSSGLEALRTAAADADIFLTSEPLAARHALGLDAQRLRAASPRLIYGAASIFGETDPDAEAPAQAIDAYAASGVAWIIGEEDRPPLIVPYAHADFQAGAHLAAASLMALIARRKSGSGQAIDISATDVLSAAVGTNAMLYLCEKLQRYDRAGRRAFASGGPYPYVILKCADGEVCLVGRARQEWTRLVEAMGNPAWTTNPRYQDLRAMGRDYPAEVDALIQPWLLQHTRAELAALAEKFGFPIGPVYQMDEVIGFAQFAHRDFFPETPHPVLGSVRLPRAPWLIHPAPEQKP